MVNLHCWFFKMIVNLYITFSSSLDPFLFISLYMNYEVVILNKILIYFVKKIWIMILIYLKGEGKCGKIGNLIEI